MSSVNPGPGVTHSRGNIGMYMAEFILDQNLETHFCFRVFLARKIFNYTNKFHGLTRDL